VITSAASSNLCRSLRRLSSSGIITASYLYAGIITASYLYAYIIYNVLQTSKCLSRARIQRALLQKKTSYFSLSVSFVATTTTTTTNTQLSRCKFNYRPSRSILLSDVAGIISLVTLSGSQSARNRTRGTCMHLHARAEFNRPRCAQLRVGLSLFPPCST